MLCKIKMNDEIPPPLPLLMGDHTPAPTLSIARIMIENARVKGFVLNQARVNALMNAESLDDFINLLGSYPTNVTVIRYLRTFPESGRKICRRSKGKKRAKSVCKSSKRHGKKHW
jgi:hypothetical protein